MSMQRRQYIGIVGRDCNVGCLCRCRGDKYIGIVGGLYGEKWGRMCARSLVLGRLSGEGARARC